MMKNIEKAWNELEDQQQGTSQAKPYESPAIIHELELEVRTGSPVDIDPLNPFGEE